MHVFGDIPAGSRRADLLLFHPAPRRRRGLDPAQDALPSHGPYPWPTCWPTQGAIEPPVRGEPRAGCWNASRRPGQGPQPWPSSTGPRPWPAKVFEGTGPGTARRPAGRATSTCPAWDAVREPGPGYQCTHRGLPGNRGALARLFRRPYPGRTLGRADQGPGRHPAHGPQLLFPGPRAGCRPRPPPWWGDPWPRPFSPSTSGRKAAMPRNVASLLAGQRHHVGRRRGPGPDVPSVGRASPVGRGRPGVGLRDRVPGRARPAAHRPDRAGPRD